MLCTSGGPLSSCGARTSHRGGFSCSRARTLRCVGFSSCGQGAGSLIVAHELSCPIACGIFIDQGSNWCPLLYKKDSYCCLARVAPKKAELIPRMFCLWPLPQGSSGTVLRHATASRETSFLLSLLPAAPHPGSLQATCPLAFTWQG